MKQIYFYSVKEFICLLVLLIVLNSIETKAQCDPLTPTFTLDLSGAPNATSVTPSTPRFGTCCTGPDPCVKIVVILNPNSMALLLEVIGANPGGSLNYEFDCDGTLYPGGTPLCLSGTGAHTLTACKVGGNSNAYSVTAVPKPAVPDSIFVRSGCTQTLGATGFSVPTIQWTTVNAGTNTALFNSYLSCTAGCATVVVTPAGTVPVPFIDYRVSGIGAAPCGTNSYADTVRVFFYNDLAAPLSPTTICFGSISAVLSPSPTGGKPAYTYSWSTGSTNQNITVGAGTYSVKVFDQTGCPPITSTVVVSQFTLPITANPGPAQTVCKLPVPLVPLNGTIGIASGGIWSGGTGTITPSNTVLSISYIPTPAEISTGSVQLNLTSTGNLGCPPGIGSVVVSFQNPPVVAAGIDRTVCANNNPVVLSGTITGFAATALWSTIGTGTFSSLTNTNTIYTPGLTDIITGSTNVVFTSTNNGVCAAARDTVKIIVTPQPTVNAGPDQTICSINQAALSGTVIGPTNTGTWSSTGDGSFNPTISSLTASYTPGANDLLTGTVSIILTSSNNGNCFPVRDTLKLTISKQATVNAGPNKVMCSNSGTVALTGTITGATTTGSWSTSGTGNFNPGSALLNTTYSTTANDITNASVVFTLTSTNNGVCPAVKSTMSVAINPLSSVNAGANVPVCSINTIPLTGIVSTGTGSWSSTGAGNFSPSNTNLTNSYSLTAADIASGLVTFSLTSTTNGVCPPVVDSVRIRIVRQPTLTIGSYPPVCSNLANVVLNATVTGGNGTGIWTTSGSGGFNPGASVLTTSYAIQPADITNGSVIFTLTATNQNPCTAAPSTVQVSIIQIATVAAGPNNVICSSQNTISLTGAVLGSSGTGSWTASGSGGFSSSTSLNTSYSLTPSDLLNGSVIFTLTSTGNGSCPTRNDSVKIVVVRHPTLNIGTYQPACSNQTSVALDGTVTGGAGTAIWSSSGSGGFNPGATSLITSYLIQPSDIQNGSVAFTFSATNQGPCPVTTASVSITVLQMATVSAGPNAIICSSQNFIPLTGNIAGSTNSGSWTANGSGGFVNSFSVSTAYTITPADITAGSVIFTLSSTNNGTCPQQKDTVRIKITREPVAIAGTDQSLCSTAGNAILSGTVTGGGAAGSWISSGSGVFTPGPGLLNTTYQFSAGDISNGSVTLRLTSMNSTPCLEDSDTMTVNIKTPALVNPGSYVPVCSSQLTIALNGAVAGSSGSGSWLASGTGTFSNNTNLSTTYSFTPADIASGSVVFTLTSTNNGGCLPVSGSTNVSIQKLATVLASPDQTVCSTLPVLSLSGVINGVTNSGVWSTTGTGSFVSGNLTNSSYSISTADVNQGTLFFGLTSTNNNACPPVSDTMRVTIIKNPVINIKLDTTICEKQSPFPVNANVSGGTGSFQWTSNGSGSFVPNNFSIPTNYVIGPGDANTGNVFLTLKSINNGPCGDVSASMKINVLPSAKANFAASAYDITLPSEPIKFTNLSIEANAYTWTFGDGGTSNQPHPAHKFTTVGFYTVVLVANNKYACRDTAEREIKVISDVFLPNAFTPNPGGSNGGVYDKESLNNDVFFPYTGGVVEFNMMIFNRWGELIFQSKDINIGWDGYFNGKICQQDTYVWKIDLKFFDNRTYNKTGSITLLR